MVVNLASKLNLGVAREVKQINTELLALSAMQYRDNYTLTDYQTYEASWEGDAVLGSDIGRWRATFTPKAVAEADYMAVLEFSAVDNSGDVYLRESYKNAYMESMSADKTTWMITICPNDSVEYPELVLSVRVTSNVEGTLVVEGVTTDNPRSV